MVAPAHRFGVLARATHQAQDLLASGDPITFYDTYLVLRAVRGQAPSPAFIGALAALHDSPNATDGARGMVLKYLRAKKVIGS